jgi:beta-glucosidase
VRERDWVVAPGEYALQVCRSATEVDDERTVTLAGDDVVPELTLQSSVAEWFAHPVAGPQLLEGFLASMPEGAAETHEGMLQMIGSMPMRRFAADFGAAIPVTELERLVVAAGSARAR